MTPSFKKVILAVCGGCLFLLFGILAYYFVFTLTPQSGAYIDASEAIKAHTDEDYQRFFIEHIDVFYRIEGINGMIARVAEALTEGQINMFVCHSLAHDIGHYGGYPEHFVDIKDYLSKENLDFCGSGFQHGVEAQLANLAYPQNAEGLYYFCGLVLPFEPYYGGCYHGAGHSFMENTRNMHEALGQCDLLTFDEYTDARHCYRGVFSEHANMLHETGASGERILAACNNLEGTLQYECAMEVNGLEINHSATGAEIERVLRICVENDYAFDVKRGCVRSVAWVAVDHIVGNQEVVLPPAYLMQLPEPLIREYIDAAFGTFAKIKPYVKDTLEPFCMAFVGTSKEFCNARLAQE